MKNERMLMEKSEFAERSVRPPARSPPQEESIFMLNFSSFRFVTAFSHFICICSSRFLVSQIDAICFLFAVRIEMQIFLISIWLLLDRWIVKVVKFVHLYFTSVEMMEKKQQQHNAVWIAEHIPLENKKKQFETSNTTWNYAFEKCVRVW